MINPMSRLIETISCIDFWYFVKMLIIRSPQDKLYSGINNIDVKIHTDLYDMK